MHLDKFTLSVDTENAAFEDEFDARFEMGQILRKIAKRVEDGDFHPGHTMSILDSNGNRIGSYKWK